MYPINMQLESGVGFAVANDEAEYSALTAHGYISNEEKPKMPNNDLPKAPAESAPAKRRGRPPKAVSNGDGTNHY